MTDAIRLGTRRSALAVAQSSLVAHAIEEASGWQVQLVEIVSEGDTSRASLVSMGGTGVFATRLREALLADECDLLVHSLKDLPVAIPHGLVIAAVPQRADARDVVITRDGTPLAELPAGSTVGTGSPRRVAQVLRANPALDVRDLRGNVDSRLARVRGGELDAVVLAAAGLERLGAELDLHVEPRALDAWPTAAGQGALAVETREGGDLVDVLAQLDHPATRAAVTAEREVLGRIGAGCHAPVGVHATFDGDQLQVAAVVYGADAANDVRASAFSAPAQEYIRAKESGADAARREALPEARRIGAEAADLLLARGAAGLMQIT
ncbi:MAG: hydroxymethylbilane synthase [Microbacterium sp.]